MSHSTNRRTFLQTTAAAGAGLMASRALRAQADTSPNGKLQFACVGIGGKGSSDSEDAGRHGEVVGICDIDEQRLEAAAKKYPNAKRFVDFREMFTELGDKVDAVTVSTPDHTHAVAAVMAMKNKKHVYCQKPLTHSLYEARAMAEAAAANGVVTQMGNQGTSNNGLRKASAIIQAGTLGKVNEVHVWTNRPIWPQGGGRPEASECPAHVKWDLWLGPAPSRPYAKGYHPFAWRGWWDFGTGALGDMACHTLNMPFHALGLRDPISVEAKTSGHNKESYPKWSVITFEFPANANRPALKFVWYDGGKRPDIALFDGTEIKGEAGALVIGDKGKLYTPGDYCDEFKLLGGVEAPEVDFVRSPGHFTEWVEAIKDKSKKPMSNIPDYSGPLTETVLLGNLAVWADGKKIEWDAKNLKATNAPEVETVIRPQFRDGWTL